MASDKNTYALSVSLQLDSAAAFTTLDTFGDKLIKIEENIASAASEALSSIDNVVGTLDKSLDRVLIKTQDITKAAETTAAQYVKSGAVNIDLTDNAGEQCKSFEEQYDTLEDIVETQDKLIKGTKEELLHHEQMTDSIEEYHKILLKKNKGHKDENKSVKEEGILWQMLRSQLGDGVNELKQMHKMYVKILRDVREIGDAISKASQIQEEFVTNNYRLYGSMEGIVLDVRSLSYEYGILEKDALKAYKALADVKTPREEIDKMARTVIIMNRITGVGMKTLAEYSKRLRSMGGSAASTEIHFSRLQNEMRKTGLTADDMNKLIGDTEVSLLVLNTMFGDNEGVQAFTELKVAAAGMAEGLGANADGVSKQLNAMTNDIGTFSRIAMKSGDIAELTGENIGKAYFGAAKTFAAYHKELMSLGMTSAYATRQVLAQHKAFGYVSEDAAYSAMQIGKYALEMEAAGKEFATFEDLTKSYLEEMEKTWNATQRFTNSWKDLKKATGEVFTELLNLMGIVLVPMIRILVKVLNAITKVVNTFVGWYDALRTGDSASAQFVRALENIFGIVMAGIVVIGGAIFTIGKIILAWKVAAGAFTGGAGLISTALGAVTGSLGAVGAAITGTLGTIGTALQAFGRMISKAALPLLAVAAAMVLAAGSVWIFAQAIKTLEGVDYGYIAAGVGMLIVMAGVVVVAFALMGGAAMTMSPVLPFLYMFGGALLIIAAAAVGFGFGIKLAADSLRDMHLAMTEHKSPALYELLPMLAIGIAAVGAASIFAAPGLWILTGVAWALAGAMRVATPALEVLMYVIEKISAEKMTEFASAFLSASWKISAALFILAPAIALLPGISTALLFSAPILWLAINTIASALENLGISLQMIADSVKTLAEISLAKVAKELAIGAFYLGGAAYPLLIASKALVPSSIALWFVGKTISRSASVISDGSSRLLNAAKNIHESSELLQKSGVIMRTSAKVLGEGSKAFAIAIVSLDVVLEPLGNVGKKLIPASKSLAAGLKVLFSAVKGFDKDIQSFESIIRVMEAFTTLSANFKKPADELAGALNNLGDAISGFGVGDLGARMSQLVTVLERYASRIEAVAERIAIAVDSKAVPAMTAAETAGIEEAVKSEAITQVQVTTDIEGQENAANESNEIAVKMIEVLQNIDEKLDGLGGDKAIDILDVLQQYLPQLVKSGGENLSSEMNAWMR